MRQKRKVNFMLYGQLLAGSAIAVFVTLTSPMADAAESVSGAVSSMTQDQRQQLMKAARQSIDTMSTGSIGSSSDFDARGVIKPNAEVTIGAGISARIIDLPYKAGSSFKKGDVLLAFDCARQQADLRGAEAGLKKAAQIHKTKLRLKSRGAAGSQEVLEAEADREAAGAKRDALREQTTACMIHAPFSGRVVERHVESYETPAANAPLITVIDDSSLELDLIVPSNWLRWMRTGSTFSFEVDELGQNYDAKIVRLGAKVDAVSQTVKMTGTFVERPENVLAGMSGTARFSPPTN